MKDRENDLFCLFLNKVLGRLRFPFFARLLRFAQILSVYMFTIVLCQVRLRKALVIATRQTLLSESSLFDK